MIPTLTPLRQGRRAPHADIPAFLRCQSMEEARLRFQEGHGERVWYDINDDHDRKAMYKRRFWIEWSVNWAEVTLIFVGVSCLIR